MTESSVASTYLCQAYGEVASTITLVPPGGRNPLIPGPGEPGYDAGRAEFVSDAWEVVMDGPIRSSQVFLPGMGFDRAALVAALESGDPIALYGINTEFAPFWCPRCARTYCPSHWAVWVDHDEMFYDCTWGRCPEGHQRILDD